MSFTVCLTGGAPWGFRLQGGKEFGEPLRIAKINPNSKAQRKGLKIGDIVDSINGDKTQGLMHNEALKIIKSTPDNLELCVRRGGSALPNGDINGLSQTSSSTSLQLETESGAPSRQEYKPSPLGGVTTTMTSSLGTVESSRPAGQDSPPLSPSIVSAFAVARELKQKTSRVPTLAHFETVTADHHDTLPQSPTRPSRGMNIFMKQQSRLNKEEAGQPQGQLSPSNQPDQYVVPPEPSSGKKAPPPPVRQKPVQSLLSPSRPTPPSPVGAPPTAAGSSVKMAPPVPKKTVSSAGVKKTPFYFDTFESQRSFVIDQVDGKSFEENNNKPVIQPALGSASNPKPLEVNVVEDKPFHSSSLSPQTGMWKSNSNAPFLPAEQRDFHDRGDNSLKDMSHVWGPGGNGTLKKEYRPIRLDTSALVNGRKTVSPQPSPVAPPIPAQPYFASSETSTLSSLSSPGANPPQTFSSAAGIQLSSTSSHLPKSQSPTVTLLQKTRDDVPPPPMYNAGEIPRGAVYVGSKEMVDGDVKHTDTFYMLPANEQTVTRTVTEHKAPKYGGIGPVEEETGVPVGLRSTIDDDKQHDWYKEMFKSLHKTERPEERWTDSRKEENPYTPTYQFPEPEPESKEEHESKRALPDRSQSVSTNMYESRYNNTGERNPWLPDARSQPDRYRVQPRSIIDYEPGFSSIAFQEAKKTRLYNPPIEKPGQFSSYTLPAHLRKKADAEKAPITRRSLSPTEQKSTYLHVLKGGEVPVSGFRKPVPEPTARHAVEFGPAPQSVTRVITPKSPPVGKVKKPRPRSSLSAAEQLGVKSTSPIKINSGVPSHHYSSSDIPVNRSPGGSIDRKTRDEREAKRKEILRQYEEEERKKKVIEEQKKNEARRHSDYFTSKQKSPIPGDRFNEGLADIRGPVSPRMTATKRASGVEIKGKARAIYNFKAQNAKELSFKKGDTILLTRQIDKNWFEGEHHGCVGIFPVNYVEVLTSLETATALAFGILEGLGRAKYNFNAQTAVELPLKKGEEVVLLRRVDDNWFEAKVGTRQGIVPVSYIDVAQHPGTPLATPSISVSTTPARGSPVGPLSPAQYNGPTRTHPTDLSPNYMGQRPGDRPASQHSPRYTSDRLSPVLHGQMADHRASPAQFAVVNDRFDGGRQPYSQQPTVVKTSSTVTQSAPRQQYQPPPPPPQHQQYQPPAPQHQQRAPVNRMEEPQRRVDMREQELPVYRAIYTYMPQNEDELEMREGDTVYVMEKCDDGWFVGTSARTGQFGTFPGNYVNQS